MKIKNSNEKGAKMNFNDVKKKKQYQKILELTFFFVLKSSL